MGNLLIKRQNPTVFSNFLIISIETLVLNKMCSRYLKNIKKMENYIGGNAYVEKS